MSAIAGVCQVDGSPVDPELLGRMRDIVDYRGPDGSGGWMKGKVGFAHRLLWTTEESVHEKQPLTDGRGLWITADCRIDNREELKREFESRGIWPEIQSLFDPFPPPDSAYILFAYELWREDSPNHLLGDFAFAIWDEKRQTIFCARDPLGIKIFHYYWDGKKFLFGSEMKQIFQDPTISEELNLLYFADVLLQYSLNREDTPFQAIKRLPPGHVLTIRNANFQIKRYFTWDPDQEPLSQASLMENAEILLSLLQKAVKARLRRPPDLRVGSLLSGGLDSSSIVSLAAREIPRLPVFTLYFPEASPAYQLKGKDWVDESPYVDSLLEKYDLDPHRIEIKGWGLLENFEKTLWHQETIPFFPNLVHFQYLFQQAKNSHTRVLLHGEGGDENFTTGSFCLSDEFKRGHWLEVYKEWMARRKVGTGSYREFFRCVARTFLPGWVKIPYRSFFGREVIPDWINPLFAKKFSLKKRAKKAFSRDDAFRQSSSYGIRVWLESGTTANYLEAIDRATQSTSIEIQYPFLDLRLLRFSASLPWNQKVRGGVKKIILRETLKDFLPTLIQNRLRKAEFTPVIRTSIERYASQALREVLENPHPLLDSMIVRGKIRPFEKPKSFWSIWHLIAIDQWLKLQRSFKPQPKETTDEKKQEIFCLTTKES